MRRGKSGKVIPRPQNGLKRITSARAEEIIAQVMKNKGMTRADAIDWLAQRYEIKGERL